MDYKKLYNKFNITHELLVNRYMLSVILCNLYTLIDAVQSKERMMSSLIDKKKQREVLKRQKQLDIIEFEHFAITNTQYRLLLDEYGAEVVTNACVILDKFIQNLGRPLKNPYKKLKEWAINLSMKDKLSEYTSTITQAITAVDYKTIEDEAMARQYIAGTPVYLRSVDEGCKYLMEKFNLWNQTN